MLPVYTNGKELPATHPDYPTTVQVKYLGAGGVVIKRGDDVVVTAPFFSNPSIPRVAFGEVAAREDEIRRSLERPGNGLAGAKAILVGHAHYDHLMDVPFIWSTYMRQAKIYGSDTMKNTLAAFPIPADRVVSVEPDMHTDTKAGTWYPKDEQEPRRVRFMALKSEHAPIFWHIKFFEGAYDSPLKEKPTRAYQWREGQTLAYLIDFMSADGKTVEFRVHYQDAASTPPLGFPPDDGRRVDLALICMPGFNQVKNYPEELIERLQPRFVVLIHWEDFFAPLPESPSGLRTVAGEDAELFLERLQAVLHGKPFKLPAPGAWMSFAP